MARTKQTARMSTGGKAPRLSAQLPEPTEHEEVRVVAPVDMTPNELRAQLLMRYYAVQERYPEIGLALNGVLRFPSSASTPWVIGSCASDLVPVALDFLTHLE